MSATHRTLPVCSLTNLLEWFFQVEQEFLLRNITTQTTKFRLLVTNLLPELLLTFGDLLHSIGTPLTTSLRRPFLGEQHLTL